MRLQHKKQIDLNTAEAEQLETLPLIEHVVPDVLRRRPFKSWESFKQVFGLDEDAAELLRQAGATLESGSQPKLTRRIHKRKSAKPAEKMPSVRATEIKRSIKIVPRSAARRGRYLMPG